MFSENPQPAQGVSSITQRRDGDQYTVRRHKSTPHSQPVSSRYGKAQSIHFSGWEAALPAHFVYFCSGTLGKWVLVIQKKLLLLSPSPSLPLGLSPPFFWFPADIEVQFSATRPPGETPSTPEGQRWGSDQCATWAGKAEQSRRGSRGGEEGEERVEETGRISILLTAFPFTPTSHALSLPDTSSAERPAGKGGSWGEAGGGDCCLDDEGGDRESERGEEGTGMRSEDVLHSRAWVKKTKQQFVNLNVEMTSTKQFLWIRRR